MFNLKFEFVFIVYQQFVPMKNRKKKNLNNCKSLQVRKWPCLLQFSTYMYIILVEYVKVCHGPKLRVFPQRQKLHRLACICVY